MCDNSFAIRMTEQDIRKTQESHIHPCCLCSDGSDKHCFQHVSTMFSHDDYSESTDHKEERMCMHCGKREYRSYREKTVVSNDTGWRNFD